MCDRQDITWLSVIASQLCRSLLAALSDTITLQTNANVFLTFLDHLRVQGRPVFQSSSIFDIVLCLQSVGISSCLPVCCPSISFSVGLCSFSQKPLVLEISHRCGCVLASSSGQTTIVFCFQGKFQQVLRPPPS